MALGYDGSIRIDTKINSAGFNSGISSMSKSLTKLAGAIGLAFGISAAVNFGKESVKAASQLSSALTGLQSIVDGQGRSFQQAQGFINEYIKDGLIPMQNAVTAYKNLSMRGYGTEQIEKTMLALKDSATFGRQASLTMGDAVASATEGLKNENSILVDNAGVTKNVSIMWKEYADSIGVGVQSLTKQQKIQAEVNGILAETRFQTGDAAKAVDTYAGQMSMLSFNFQQLKVAVGNAVIPIVQAALPAVNTLISSFTGLANIVAQVTTALFGGGAIKDQTSAEEDLADAGDDAAGSTNDLADGIGNIGDAYKKTEKDVDGATATFDQLNQMAGEASKSMDQAADDMDKDLSLDDMGGGTLFGNVQVSPEVLDFIERIKRALESVQEEIRKISELFAVLGSTFSQVWKSGAGEEAMASIASIANGVLKIFSTLAERIKIAWMENENGVRIWTAIMDIVQSLLSFIDRIVQATVDWASELDLGPIMESFAGLLEAIKPFVDFVLNQLAWIYESILLPFGKWVIEEAAPISIDILATAFELLTDVLEAVKPFADWIMEKFLIPLAEWTGDGIISGLENVKHLLESLVSLINLDFAGAMDNLSKAFENGVSFFVKSVKDFADATVDLVVSVSKFLVDIVKESIDAIASLFGFGESQFAKSNIPKSSSFSAAPASYSAVKYDIPHLAKGAVIPPNKPFVSVLGDQHSGVNIESPLSTIEQAVSNAMQRSGGSSAPVNVTVKFEGSLSQLARVLRPAITAEAARSGQNALGSSMFEWR